MTLLNRMEKVFCAANSETIAVTATFKLETFKIYNKEYCMENVCLDPFHQHIYKDRDLTIVMPPSHTTLLRAGCWTNSSILH